LGTLVGLMQSYGFLSYAPRVLHQLQFVDQFITFVLPLAAVRSGVGALLDVVAREGKRGIACASRVLGLVDVGAFRRDEPLLFAMKVQIGFGQCDSGGRTQLFIDGEQKVEILISGDAEWIDLKRGSPLCGGR